MLLGSDANEFALAEAVRKGVTWNAVHLACHGFVNDADPILSSLALSLAKQSDGFFTAAEVMRSHIPANLVTLSACETGRGRIVSGEGLVGLTRAFMYAGTPRVICSLWKVDDEATSALMRRFYELWNPPAGDGVSAAEALHQAQAHVASQTKWAHPYYWAAWVLWGRP